MPLCFFILNAIAAIFLLTFEIPFVGFTSGRLTWDQVCNQVSVFMTKTILLHSCPKLCHTHTLLSFCQLLHPAYEILSVVFQWDQRQTLPCMISVDKNMFSFLFNVVPTFSPPKISLYLSISFSQIFISPILFFLPNLYINIRHTTFSSYLK